MLYVFELQIIKYYINVLLIFYQNFYFQFWPNASFKSLNIETTTMKTTKHNYVYVSLVKKIDTLGHISNKTWQIGIFHDTCAISHHLWSFKIASHNMPFYFII